MKLFSDVCSLKPTPHRNNSRTVGWFPIAMTSLCLCLCLTNCSKKQEGTVLVNLRNNPRSEGAPVVKLKNDSITAEQIDRYFKEMPPAARERYADFLQRKHYVELLAGFELLLAEASARRLDQHPDIALATRKAMVELLLRQELDEKADTISDEKVKAYFEAHRSDFVKPETVRVFHIFWAAPMASKERASKEKVAQLVLQKAKALAHQDYQGFAYLVREYSEDKSVQAVDGDLRFLSFEDMLALYGKSFAEAAYALQQPGEVSAKLVATERGFHILKMQARQAAVNATVEQMKPQILQILAEQQRMDKYRLLLERLSKNYQLVIDDKAIQFMKIDVQAPAVSSFPSAPGMAPPTHHGMN